MKAHIRATPQMLLEL